MLFDLPVLAISVIVLTQGEYMVDKRVGQGQFLVITYVFNLK